MPDATTGADAIATSRRQMDEYSDCKFEGVVSFGIWLSRRWFSGVVTGRRVDVGRGVAPTRRMMIFVRAFVGAEVVTRTKKKKKRKRESDKEKEKPTTSKLSPSSLRLTP